MENRFVICLAGVILSLALIHGSASAASADQKQKQKNPPAAAKKDPPKPKGDTPAANSKSDNALKGLFNETPAQGQGPLFIKSDSLELNSKDRVFLYKGNVEIVRNDVTITARYVEGRYDDQNRIQTIICKENVVITRGEAMRATSNRAVYNVLSGTIELTEGPELYREGNALAADKVIVYINEDRSEAEGNVRVKVIKTEDQQQ
jgi:lipopolysaccharide transport protein LptA